MFLNLLPVYEFLVEPHKFVDMDSSRQMLTDPSWLDLRGRSYLSNSNGDCHLANPYGWFYYDNSQRSTAFANGSGDSTWEQPGGKYATKNTSRDSAVSDAYGSWSAYNLHRGAVPAQQMDYHSSVYASTRWQLDSPVSDLYESSGSVDQNGDYHTYNPRESSHSSAEQWGSHRIFHQRESSFTGYRDRNESISQTELGREISDKIMYREASATRGTKPRETQQSTSKSPRLGFSRRGAISKHPSTKGKSNYSANRAPASSQHGWQNQYKVISARLRNRYPKDRHSRWEKPLEQRNLGVNYD